MRVFKYRVSTEIRGKVNNKRSEVDETETLHMGKDGWSS